MSSKDQEYQVGYGKPPKQSQFQPGRSGNPGGRPKGQKTLHNIIQQLCEETVSVLENGKKKQMTKFQVAAASLFNKASKGNVQAIKLLLALKSEADHSAHISPGADLSHEDQEVLLSEIDWLAMTQQAHMEVDDDNSD